MSGALCLLLESDAVYALDREGAGGVTRIAWRPEAPAPMAEALRAEFGTPSALVVIIGLAFLEIAEPQLPPVSNDVRVRMLQRDSDRYFALREPAAVATDGTVAFAMDAPSVVNPLIKAGRLNAIAVAVPKRMKTLPDIPTFDEAGLKGYRAYSWNAIWAPAGTPAAILERLNAAVNKAVADPTNQRQIDDAGVVAYPAMSRGQVEAFMKSEYETWVPLVRAMKIKLD